jgi:hypothetical protein
MKFDFFRNARLLSFVGMHWSLWLVVLCLRSSGGDLVPDLLVQDPTTRGTVPQAFFGSALAVKNDLAVVGAPFSSQVGLGQGVAYVLRRSNHVWSVVQTLLPMVAVNGAHFGSSVAITDDGSTLFVGSPVTYGYDNGLNGAVIIFTNSVRGFEEAGKLVGPAYITTGVGQSMALSGNLLLVGTARGQSGLYPLSGGALLYARTGNTWALERAFSPEEPAQRDGYGTSVAIDPAGERLAIGAPGTRDSRGSVFTYRKSNGAWSLENTYSLPLAGMNEAMGTSIALSSDYLVAGVPGIPESILSPKFVGAVRVFSLKGGLEPLITLASATNSHAGNRFGTSVAIQGEIIAVGAPGYSLGTNLYTGATYLFERDGSTWVERTVISPVKRDLAAGQVVVLDGETVAYSGTFADNGAGRVFWHHVAWDDGAHVASFSRRLLYYPDAYPSGIYGKDKAAFRFKHFLYERDLSDPGQRIRARFDKVGDFYGAVERGRSTLAEQRLWRAVAAGAATEPVKNTLLDIAYDRALALAIEARFQRSKLDRIRHGSPGSADRWVIDQEVGALEEISDRFREALDSYFGGLEAVPTASPESSLVAFFSALTPARSLEAATVDSSNGVASVIGGNPQILSGYKDAVLLLDLLRDQAQTAVELGRLYLAQGTTAGRSNLLNLLSTTKTALIGRQSELLRFLPGLLEDSNEIPGLESSFDSLAAAVSELDRLDEQLTRPENPLGYSSNFLVLVQQFQGGPQALFDSFDAFRQWLSPQSASTPLAVAVRELQNARDASSTYRGYLDQLQAQHAGMTNQIGDRLRALGGSKAADGSDESPETAVGSEFWQQLNTIDVARLRIDRNQAELFNLGETVRIETERRLKEHQINARISSVRVKYGNVYAKFEEELGKLEAVQAAATGVGSAVGSSFSASSAGAGGVAAVGQLATGIVGAAVEYQKGQLNAQRARYAAMEQAEIDTLEDGLLDNESKAQIKTWLLQMNTLVIDSLEAVVLLKQELGRLATRYDEYRYLKAQLASVAKDLDSRYFADPAHQLRATFTSQRADLAFTEAQSWIFYMIRAFEYKWNTPFTYTRLGRVWDLSTLFRLRNAEELLDLYETLVAYDGILQTSNNSDDYFDWFSVRQHFFGLPEVNNEGQALRYTDPETGEIVTSKEMFRRRLARAMDTNGVIRLEFSTVRELPGGTFFRGPRFLPNGQLDSLQKGLYLDKIHWLKIRLPGNHRRNRTFLTGSLTYGGVSYLRNFHVGTPDPIRADQLLNEFQTFNTSYWFYDPSLKQWQSNPVLSVPVQMWLSNDPRLEGSPQQVDVLPSVEQVEAFKERSVATSQWTLILPTKDQGSRLLTLEELDDIEIYFYHHASVRQ